MVYKGPRLEGEARAQMRKRLRMQYEAGKSIRVIAGLHGRSYGWAYTLLTEAGTEFRRRGGQVTPS